VIYLTFKKKYSHFQGLNAKQHRGLQLISHWLFANIFIRYLKRFLRNLRVDLKDYSTEPQVYFNLNSQEKGNLGEPPMSKKGTKFVTQTILKLHLCKTISDQSFDMKEKCFCVCILI